MSPYERNAKRKEYKAHAMAVCLFVTFPIWVLPWALFELYQITQQSAWEWLDRREDVEKTVFMTYEQVGTNGKSN